MNSEFIDAIGIFICTSIIGTFLFTLLFSIVLFFVGIGSHALLITFAVFIFIAHMAYFIKKILWKGDDDDTLRLR